MIFNFVFMSIFASTCGCYGIADFESYHHSLQSSLRGNGYISPKSHLSTHHRPDQYIEKDSFAVDQIKENLGSLFPSNKPLSRDLFFKSTSAHTVRRRPNVLHLRGGYFENIWSLCSCFNVCDSGIAVHDENGGKDPAMNKRRVGRMAQSVDVKASSQKVYKVVSDIEHYRDWSGDGLRSIKILENGRGYAVAEYVCGTFGFTFHFSMYWGLASAGNLIFISIIPTLIQVPC
jgi:hypothetical protein